MSSFSLICSLCFTQKEIKSGWVYSQTVKRLRKMDRRTDIVIFRGALLLEKKTFEPIYLWRYAIGIILEQDRRTKDLRSVIEMLRHLRWLLINIHLIVISYASSNFFILEATSQVLSGSRPTVQYIRLAVQNSTVQYNVGLIPVLSGFRPTV